MRPLPTPLPSMTTTRVSKAQYLNKRASYGKKDTSSKTRSLSRPLAKRLTRVVKMPVPQLTPILTAMEVGEVVRVPEESGALAVAGVTDPSTSTHSRIDMHKRDRRIIDLSLCYMLWSLGAQDGLRRRVDDTPSPKAGYSCPRRPSRWETGAAR